LVKLLVPHNVSFLKGYSALMPSQIRQNLFDEALEGKVNSIWVLGR
jgi:hypothetical protein